MHSCHIIIVHLIKVTRFLALMRVGLTFHMLDYKGFHMLDLAYMSESVRAM